MKPRAKQLKGHALQRIYSFDSVSHKSQVVCECGWNTCVGSAFRGRESHREHKRLICEEYLKSLSGDSRQEGK